MANKQDKSLLKRRKARWGWLFIAPWVLGFAMFFAFPVFESLYFSMNSLKMSPTGFATTWVGLDNYRDMFREPRVLNAIGFTFKYFFVAIFFETLLGLILLVIPGILALVFLSLAGPVVEIEDRGIKAAFARSFRLVRRDFWLVFWVLATIKAAGVLIGQGIEHLARAVFGERTLVDSLAEGSSSVLLEPLFAVAIVLLMQRWFVKGLTEGEK